MKNLLSFLIINIVFILLLAGCSQDEVDRFVAENNTSDTVESISYKYSTQATTSLISIEPPAYLTNAMAGHPIEISFSVSSSDTHEINESLVTQRLLLLTDDNESIMEPIGVIGFENLSSDYQTFSKKITLPDSIATDDYKVVVINSDTNTTEVISDLFTIESMSNKYELEVYDFKTGLGGNNFSVINDVYKEIYNSLKPYIEEKFAGENISVDEVESVDTNITYCDSAHLHATFRYKNFGQIFDDNLSAKIEFEIDGEWVEAQYPSIDGNLAATIVSPEANQSHEEQVASMGICLPESKITTLFDKYLEELNKDGVTVVLPTKLSVSTGEFDEYVKQNTVQVDMEIAFSMPESFIQSSTTTSSNNIIASKVVDLSGSSDGKVFDGVDDYVDVGTLDIDDSWTIIIEAKPTEDNVRDVLVSDYDGSNANIGFELHKDNKLRVYYKNGTHNLYSSANEYQAGNWYTFIVKKDASDDTLKAYVNSKEVIHKDNSSDLTNSSRDFKIGRDSRTGATAFKGNMRNFRFYKRAISFSEIEALVNNGTVPTGADKNLLSDGSDTLIFNAPYEKRVGIDFMGMGYTNNSNAEIINNQSDSVHVKAYSEAKIFAYVVKYAHQIPFYKRYIRVNSYPFQAHNNDFYIENYNPIGLINYSSTFSDVSLAVSNLEISEALTLSFTSKDTKKAQSGISLSYGFDTWDNFVYLDSGEWSGGMQRVEGSLSINSVQKSVDKVNSALSKGAKVASKSASSALAGVPISINIFLNGSIGNSLRLSNKNEVKLGGDMLNASAAVGGSAGLGGSWGGFVLEGGVAGEIKLLDIAIPDDVEIRFTSLDKTNKRFDEVDYSVKKGLTLKAIKGIIKAYCEMGWKKKFSCCWRTWEVGYTKDYSIKLIETPYLFNKNWYYVDKSDKVEFQY